MTETNPLDLRTIRSLIRAALLRSDNAKRQLAAFPALGRDFLLEGYRVCRAEACFDEAHWFAERLGRSGDKRGIACLEENAPDQMASAYMAGLHHRRRDRAKARRFLGIAAQQGHFPSKKELALMDWNRSILRFPAFVVGGIRLWLEANRILGADEFDPRLRRGLFE